MNVISHPAARCYNSSLMFPENEWLRQARRALNESRLDDAQGILVNVVVQEPENDEAWLLLADTLSDLERKSECLERARQINPRNPATLRAIRELKALLAVAAFDKSISPAHDSALPDHPELAEPLLQRGEAFAQAVLMTTEPADTRAQGLELVYLLERARQFDGTRTRRWAGSIGRDALVKYERALTQLITNLPHTDPQLATLRDQRKRTLDLLK